MVMAGKAQSEILGTVILTGVLIVVVTITFMWGQPLIQKNIDRTEVNTAIDKLEEISDAILYTASTGSNNVVRLDLTSASFLVDELNNRIILETYSGVPIIASTEELPINYYELALMNENLAYNTTYTSSIDPQLSGYELNTRHTNTTINSEFYNVTVHQNTTSLEWNLACIWKDNAINQASDCAKTGGIIEKEGNNYEIINILTSGEAAYMNGALIENIGVLGSEPSGIISAKSIKVGDRQKITFYLTYRAMMSPTGELYKIIINCASGCSATSSEKTLIVSRTNTLREENITTTYVLLGVQ